MLDQLNCMMSTLAMTLNITNNVFPYITYNVCAPVKLQLKRFVAFIIPISSYSNFGIRISFSDWITSQLQKY